MSEIKPNSTCNSMETSEIPLKDRVLEVDTTQTVTVNPSMTPDPSTKVPNEIWVKILSLLKPKEIVRSRLVCSIFRNLVDEHFSFSVIVHDDKTDLKRIFELKIKDCLITKLYQDVDILKYPEILKRARFWGSIHPLSMHRILSQASNLEELSLTRYPLTQRNLLSQNQSLNLRKLIKLEILGYCCKDASEEVSNNVIHLISQNMASLSKVFLNVTCYWKYMDPIVIAFFDFLARHKSHISHVNASLIPAANGHELISLLPTKLSQITKDSLYKDDEQLQLKSLRLTIASKYIPCWGPIIQKQKKLVDLRIHWIASSEQPQSHLTGISSKILYPAIIQSASTLVHLDLKDLNLSIDEDTRNPVPFDASILKCAQNLRRLVLVRNKDDCQRNPEQYGSPTIVNIDNLHPALVDLEIVRFKCLTSELIGLVENSENIKSVKLQHTGSTVGYGVHGGVIELLTSKPSIKIINISPINYHETDFNMKLETLKSKFQGISHGGDRLYFDFDRYRAGIPQPQSRYQTNNASEVSNNELGSRSSSGQNCSSNQDYISRRSFGTWRSCRDREQGCSRSQQTLTRSLIQQHWRQTNNKRSRMLVVAGSRKRALSADRHDEFQFSREVFKNCIPRSSSCPKDRYRSKSVNDF